LLDVVDDRFRRVLVVLALGELEQFARAGQAVGEVADAVDVLVERRAFSPQCLRALGVIPDIRIAELALDFLEALALGVVVKETPSAHPVDP
jgi:hypothetical protein